MLVFVDSSVWIDYFNGVYSAQTDALEEALLHHTVCVGDVILAEVLRGFRSDADMNMAREALMNLTVYAMVGVEIALKSVEDYRLLRSRGITPRKTIDTLIATFCIENNILLLHNDSDFNGYEQYCGLQVFRG
jgi:hypothetical protein